jgi:indole-3-glycerol phosphate synthase
MNIQSSLSIMSNRLLEILEHKRTEIARLDLREQMARANDAPPAQVFLPSSQWGGSNPKLIAELKRASPSRGLLAPHLNMAELAQIYIENGASALSVLTDEKFFLGELSTLHALRFTHNVPLPLLRKDFMLAPVQIYEARANGADAILLIVAALEDAVLHELHALALELGLTALVEVHTAAEVERALKIPSVSLIGINNRDLKTFNISLETTLKLRPLIPAGIRVVAESGIFTAADVAQVAAVGVEAVLVGEALVTAPDIGAKVRELSHWVIG